MALTAALNFVLGLKTPRVLTAVIIPTLFSYLPLDFPLRRSTTVTLAEADLSGGSLFILTKQDEFTIDRSLLSTDDALCICLSSCTLEKYGLSMTVERDLLKLWILVLRGLLSWLFRREDCPRLWALGDKKGISEWRAEFLRLFIDQYSLIKLSIDSNLTRFRACPRLGNTILNFWIILWD